jgi:Mannosyl-glycoprotein endo-beta-N-acetylglucosaminidase
VRLIGPPSADRNLTLNQAMHALGAHTRFGLDMFPALWDAGLRHGIDPVGLVAQSFKETGGGKFGGRVPAWYMNPCGMKVRDVAQTMRELGTTDGDHPAVHQKFWSWEAGALAQVHHVRAYAGWPVDGTVMSPRYDWVIGNHQLEQWADLGSGRWAPASDYGASIETTMRRLQGRA